MIAYVVNDTLYTSSIKSLMTAVVAAGLASDLLLPGLCASMHMKVANSGEEAIRTKIATGSMLG